MDAFEIIRKTMNEFAEVSDDTIQAFISLAEPQSAKRGSESCIRRLWHI